MLKIDDAVWMAAYRQEKASLPFPTLRRYWFHLDNVVPEATPFCCYDNSWITREMIVDFAFASLRGEHEAEKAASVLSGFDNSRIYTINSALSDYNFSFVVFKGEMLADYGLDYFRPLSTPESVCRQLSYLMSQEKDAKNYLLLETRFREMTTFKPAKKKARLKH